MAIRVYYNNDINQPCTIRPSPLCSIARNILKNGAGESFGITYTITLNGTLLADQGTPYAFEEIGETPNRYPFYGTTPNSVGPYGSFDSNTSHTDNSKPPKQSISTLRASQAIFAKQKALSALFSKDGQMLEITDFETDLPAVICYPRFVSIDFQEGVYVEKCDYTITLECDTLLNQNYKVDIDGTLIPNTSGIVFNKTESDLLNSLNASFISDYSEDWSIEVDDAVAESIDLPRTYRITHNLSATGKTHHGPKNAGDPYNIETKPAWKQAQNFVLSKLAVNQPVSGLPYPNILGNIGSGTINLVNTYRGFNHVRNEQVGVSNGTYAVTETWLLASGTAYESYNLSISSSSDNPFISVSIDGNIKGLSEYNPGSFGGTVSSSGKLSAYDNALRKYHQISNSGNFGLSSDIYKRANNSVAVQLNSQPRSISIGANQVAGDLTYNLQFDNRPTNIISGVLAESIQINDTYPGDVFAIIPVIGRKTGPVLQYIGGRTEYKRDLSINLTLDYTKVPYGSTRNSFMLQKPSLVEPMASQIGSLISEVSPAKEPGIRKYFISPPTEQWNPKEGTYNLNISWTYELDK